MKEVFKLNESQTYDFRSQNTLNVERYNTVRYGKKSLRILGPQIWSSLPIQMRRVYSTGLQGTGLAENTGFTG